MKPRFFVVPTQSLAHKKTGVETPVLISLTAAETYIFQLYWMPSEF